MTPQATIERTFTFEAAHFLPAVPAGHKCAAMHGHSYRVTVVLQGAIDPDFGWVCDFAAIDAAWAPLHSALDHRTLNNVPGLGNPTSENLAVWLFDRLSSDLPLLIGVCVEETARSCCRYFPQRAA